MTTIFTRVAQFRRRIKNAIRRGMDYVLPFSVPTTKPPASIEKPPASIEKPPASIEKPPASIEKPPASIEKPPASIEKPPASIEKPPASIEMKELPGELRLVDLVPPSLSGPMPLASLHPGARYTDLLAAARSQTVKDGTRPEADAIASAFDYTYYLAKSHDLARVVHNFDLTRHYLRAGAREGRNPSPHFSGQMYLQRYPDVKKSRENPFLHWLRTGLAEGRIGSPLPGFERASQVLGRDAAETQLEMIRLRGDLRHRFETGKLGEMVARAAAHEPLIEQVWPQMMEPHIQPLHVPHVARMMTAVYNAQAQAVFQRAKVIVCVNAPRWGAGRRLEGHLAFALAELYGPENVLMVVTDTSGEMPAWKRPENVRFVDLAGEMEGLDEPNRQRALLSFLRSLRPSAVFNVNSRTLWQLLSNYGSVMRQDTPIIGCFFCNDRNVLGFQGGYPASQFYRTFDYVRAMVTDSHFLREDLIRQFVIPQEDQNRMQVLAAPVDPAIPIAPRPETDQAAALRAAQERNRLAMPNATKSGTFLRPYPPQDAAPTRPQVFWAGRLDAQKRLDLLYAVARRLPEADVRVWGEPIAKGGAIEPDPPENLWFEGSYTRFADLPLFDAAAWLYTSAWDGVPSILLEVAMTGLPLVGSDVGGTSEVLHPDLSFPVSPFEDVDSYVNGLRAVLADPDAARSRALALRTRLISTRTDATFRKTVSRLVEGTVF